ncbi:hypothetical protein GCM10010269_47130 [Streptomyces humidus]|uniref:Uncharacterized protein n=1 Tax=Streptomyces humidus TaxID=52259 RepID=A0A918FZG0_9ACTN|nr:hypothetical protein [Streptomyces humidus]GGS02812.1 hypothetical protein GCM10010269_47130 [Streptomyces humidus]
MTGTYALISPAGSPEFREGVPDRMRKDADPRHGALRVHHSAFLMGAGRAELTGRLLVVDGGGRADTPRR